MVSSAIVFSAQRNTNSNYELYPGLHLPIYQNKGTFKLEDDTSQHNNNSTVSFQLLIEDCEELHDQALSPQLFYAQLSLGFFFKNTKSTTLRLRAPQARPLGHQRQSL
ncbi:hypothetical protein EYC80_005694 [Monilinia laxa]|uniref:Uncharacterized protein n=1 Tax=Monilinia laxa TaxID=61186 RepID=A0A5N6KEY9_MONLA|nr:hypothetical protein EYC80_005694 [Monilinia laxa]